MMRMRLPAIVAAVVQAIPLVAAAQPAPVPSDSTFGVQLFQPAPGPDNFLNVESTRIGSDFFITAGAIFHYQHRPLSIFNCKRGTGGEGERPCELEDDPQVVVIDHQVSGDLLFSVGFLKLFSAGLAVPITIWQTGNQFDFATGTATGEDLPAAFALGDLRLHLKFRLYPFMEGDKEGFGIALSPVVSFPIGSLFDDIPAAEDGASGSFLGDGFITATARVSADYYHYPFHAAVQVGYHWREKSVLYSTALGHEMVFGGAFGWWIIPDLQVLVEAYGRNGFTNEIDETPIEMDGAIRYRLGPVLLTAGGGAGIVKAIGSPVARGFLGVSFQPFEDVEVENPDRDGDGYLNDVDGCPDDAEDFDDFQDDDGCPESDNDGDTVPDAFDACVMVPEDIDGFKDEDGCPDFDHDGDGINAPEDQCPDDPEDFDGFKDEDGCPDPDNDGDGIPDMQDVCPDDPEDFDDFQDDDGCPEPDNDMDGVPDAADRCPDQPETLNGFQDEDGCPDRGNTLVVVTESRIEIKQQINFATDSDRIIGRISFQILDVVAAVLRANTHIRVEIQGHTDSQGSYEHNVDLSQRRSEAVRNYLTGAGVAADRMVARGYGPDVPIADNRTRAGRAANRRVEFHIAVTQAPAQPPVDVPSPPPPPPPVDVPSSVDESVDEPLSPPPPPVDVPLPPDEMTFK